MFTPRLALASLVSVFLAGLSSAVTFSPEFEKTLEAGLNKLKQDVQQYPKLQSAIDGIPMDTAGWAALSRDDIVTTLRFFSDQKASALKNLLITDPSSATMVEQFTTDSFQVITVFVDNIKSGAFTSAPAATTPAPTTKAPEPTTATPATTTTVPTVAATPKPSETTEAKSPMPTESASTNANAGSSSGSADESAVEVAEPSSTKPTSSAATTPAPTKVSSAAGLVSSAAVGVMAAAFCAMY